MTPARRLLLAVAATGFLATSACAPGELHLEGEAEAGPDAKLDAARPDGDRAADARTDTGTDAQRDVAIDGGEDAPIDVALPEANAVDVSVDSPPPCKDPKDCPKFEACDVMTGLCTTSCSDVRHCNEGCCQTSSVTPTCKSGNSDTACGKTGVACVDCAVSTKTCTGGVCL